MSKQKKSRQQIRLEERQARKRGVKQKPVTNKSFWKKPIFIASIVALLAVGLLYASQPKKALKSLSAYHNLPNSSVTPSLSLNLPLPEGAKIKRRGRWVMAKDLQPGDSIWHKGQWQVLRGVTTIDTLLPEDPKLPIMDYFVDPNHLQQVFAFKPIPLSKYTAKEIEIQRSFQKDNLLLSYATIPDSVYAQYDNLKLPPNQRNIDFDEITPWTWKTFNLEIVNPDSSKVKIQLRRPHWWMSQHKIKGVGSKVNLSLPDQGIGGIATVTFIRPCQIDTRLLKDRNKLGKVFRPFTSWFERTSSNVWDYAFSSREKIGATPEHPFFSEDRQLYIPIGEINIGERLRTHNGQIVTLVAKKKRSKGVEKVYNLEIYRTHTFYAGKDGFLVHNSYIIDAKDLSSISLLKKYHGDPLDSDYLTKSINFIIDEGVIKSKLLKPETRYAFVILGDGTFKIGKLESGMHYELAEGKKIIKGAGTLWLDKNGKIKKIDNSSGHYKPAKNHCVETFRTFSLNKLLSPTATHDCIDFPDDY